MKRNGIVLGIVILVVAVVAITTLTWYGNKQMPQKRQVEKGSLYSPTMLSDSSFHVNLSDESCMLVEIANGTMTIHTNNADMVGYDKTTNKVFVFYHDMQNSFTIREYYIDSLLGTVPDTTVFDSH